MVNQREVEQAVYRLTPAGTQEVADLLGLSRQGMLPRLQVLDHHQIIWSKKVGSTMVWMHPRVMPDPDPERDTSADDVPTRIFGGVYRAARNQPPFGENTRHRRMKPYVYR